MEKVGSMNLSFLLLEASDPLTETIAEVSSTVQYSAVQRGFLNY